MVEKIDKILYRVSWVVSLLSYAGFLAIMLLTVVDVVLRKITGIGITGTYELVEQILMCGVFACFAYTQSLHGHVHVTMLIRVMPAKMRLFFYSLMELVGTVAAFFLCYAAVVETDYSLQAATHTGVLGIPLFPFFGIEAISMAVFGFVLLWDVIKGFAAIKNQTLAEKIQKEWN